MGFFGTLKNMADITKNAFEEERAMNLANTERPGIDTLVFSPLPTALASVLENEKGSLFGKGDRKKFIECIREGRATYAKVLGVAESSFEMRNGTDNTRTAHFAKIATPDGVVLKESIHVFRDNFLDINTSEEDEDAWMNEDYVPPVCNSDTVSTDNRRQLYLLHYYLGNDEQYMIVTEEEFNNPSLLLNELNFPYNCLGDGSGFVWM